MPRLTQLDGLRAFAVLGVILHHAVKWEAPVPLGPYAVRLFFVLSGFLITGILLRAREKTDDRGYTIRSFYARRFLRIFPVYYFSLAVLYMLGQPDIQSTIGWHGLYLSNVLSALPDVDVVSAWGHLWSLSVEEQFYLFWPALVLFMPIRWLPYAFGGFMAIGPLFRLFVGVNFGIDPAVYLTPSCFDSLGAGALLAWLSKTPEWSALRIRLSRYALIFGSAFFLASIANTYWDVSWRFWLLSRDLGPALIFSWLVSRAADGFNGWTGRVLEWRPAVYLGTISYGMYLFHNFIPWLSESAGFPLPNHGVGRFFVLVPLTICVSAASWHFFEKPLNNLKDRFPYARNT